MNLSWRQYYPNPRNDSEGNARQPELYLIVTHRRLASFSPRESLILPKKEDRSRMTLSSESLIGNKGIVPFL
jgi:hypothetical protein